jgi:hypothetical protein
LVRIRIYKKTGSGSGKNDPVPPHWYSINKNGKIISLFKFKVTGVKITRTVEQMESIK